MSTLSQAVGASAPALIETTIDRCLAATVSEHGDREALVVRHQDVRWTYGELDQRVDELARALVGRGFVKGDRIGIWAPNCAEWVLVQLAPPGSASSWSTSIPLIERMRSSTH